MFACIVVYKSEDGNRRTATYDVVELKPSARPVFYDYSMEPEMIESFEIHVFETEASAKASAEAMRAHDLMEESMADE